MNKFLGWVAGILSVVIAGVAVAYFTKPPAQTTVQGMVFDGTSNLPLHDILVELGAKSGGTFQAFHDATNADGTYSFDVSTLGKGVSVELSVKSNVYRAERPFLLSITPGVLNHHDFEVTPVPSSTPTPPGRPVLARPKFVQKAFSEAVKVQLTKKP